MIYLSFFFKELHEKADCEKQALHKWIRNFL